MRAAPSALVLLAACASAGPPEARSSPAEWPAGPRGALTLTRGLLALDTSTQVGRARALGRLVRALEPTAAAIALESGALIARVGPRRAPDLLLLAHVDTWPVDLEAWPPEQGPWSGAVVGGALHGRGALGGKAAAALFTHAFAEHAGLATDASSSLWLVVTSSGLDPRAPQLERVLARFPELSEARLALTPGGVVLVRPDRRALGLVAVGERGFANLQLTAVGRGAPAILARALGRVEEALPPPHVTPAALRYLSDLAQITPWPERWIMRAAPLAGVVYRGPLDSAPHTRALVRTEARFGFAGSPAAATTSKDTRARAWMQVFLPGEEGPAELRVRLRGRLGPRVHVDLMDGEALVSAEATPRAILARAFEGLSWARVIGEPSQSRLLMKLGIPTAGFVPLEVTDTELATRAGVGEHVRLVGLRRAAEALGSALRVLTSSAS